MNKYDLAWFKSHALQSLKRIDSNTWDFSDSLSLYSPAGVDDYAEIQETENIYRDLVTLPETDYLSKISSEIALELPNDFDYIDLGPGTEHKERFLFDALKNQKKTFTYYPVDVSTHYLELAEDFAKQRDVKAVPVLSSFEECEDQLPPDDKYRFVSLGLTFVNYEIRDILGLLNKFIGTKGGTFINTHIRGRVDIKKIQQAYDLQIPGLLTQKLQLLDLTPNDFEDAYANDKIEIWCTIKNPNGELMQKGVKPGDKFLIMRSLRYELDYLSSSISKVFPDYKMYDTGGPFVGFLLKRVK